MRQVLQQKQNRWQWAAWLAACLACWLLFIHVDVMETANHAYLFLDSLFSGRVGSFYTDVMAHDNTLYYINNAHYSIFIYLIFGIVELPYYLINTLFGLPLNEYLLFFIGKLVSVGFFIACVPVVVAIGRELGLSGEDRHKAALAFALWPPAFFSVAIMGQYDSICLFFTLMGLLYWMRRSTVKAALWFGLGVACKFFPLLVFIPLMALVEKRPLRLLGHCALSLWMAAPLALLYAGRNGDMGFFNQLMLDRVFFARWPASLSLSVFPFLFLALCVVCYFWHPENRALPKTGVWLGLAAFGLFFLFVEWNPQWLTLLAPFAVLTTFCQRQRLQWFWLDGVFAAAFFILCAAKNPGQLEANLLDFGILGHLTGLHTYDTGYNTLSFYYGLLHPLTACAFPVFFGLLCCQIVLKFPGRQGSPADRLWQGPAPAAQRPLLWVALCSAAGLLVWALPVAFTWLKAVNFL